MTSGPQMTVSSGTGDIPVLIVRARSLPHAWEKAILALWNHATEVRTEADRRKPDGTFVDPPSLDATMIIEVSDPFAEPRIHKNIPAGPEELEVYRQEVVEGIHDHWIDPTDPLKWTYTYHQRLFSYSACTGFTDKDSHLPPVDQVQHIADKLTECFYSRRAQAITWIPGPDSSNEHPPCLQRVWCRALSAGEGYSLNMNTHWRSRDAFKAWFMNAFALTDLQRKLARMLSESLHAEVRVGRYVDISDSFHIYGQDRARLAPEVEKMRLQPDVTTRAWRSDDEIVRQMFEETARRLAENPDYMRSRSPS